MTGHSTVQESSGVRARTVPAPRWTTRDILFAATIGVVFGVVFQVANLSWDALKFLGPAVNIVYAIWLLPAVLAALLLRKPGAAVFTTLVAAGVSLLLGSPYGVDALLSGLVEGSAAELVFALTRYRSYAFPVLALAAAASAVAIWLHDWILYYQATGPDFVLAVGFFTVLSALLFVPAGAVLLARSLQRAGLLSSNAS